ncbi:uncharacterized protein N7506_000498 [Penicillium brevicompactum]|uniref:uncharacterized protein n=1 Tax=Penicillium brevicompactum TaxID=5074 RepID=UPI0025424331|nr:uncharacterized protein N7506_000498 [Penicillium brevicompactum]KAJ5347245.1 hypothetical protein N7506_000498 [Penicillium brevicompactum]
MLLGVLALTTHLLACHLPEPVLLILLKSSVIEVVLSLMLFLTCLVLGPAIPVVSGSCAGARDADPVGLVGTLDTGARVSGALVVVPRAGVRGADAADTANPAIPVVSGFCAGAREVDPVGLVAVPRAGACAAAAARAADPASPVAGVLRAGARAWGCAADAARAADPASAVAGVFRAGARVWGCAADAVRAADAAGPVAPALLLAPHVHTRPVQRQFRGLFDMLVNG